MSVTPSPNDLDLKLEVTRRALSNEEGLRLLDEQIQSQKGNYNLHVYVERKIALLRQMGKDADADKEEQKYIRLHEIRKIVVDRLVEQKQYDKAAEYAKAGIGLDNGREIRWADTMWTMRLLEIYELQDNNPGQIKPQHLPHKHKSLHALSLCERENQLFGKRHDRLHYLHNIRRTG